MKTSNYILALILLSFLTSCDPVHNLTLENQTNNKIEVIYYPSLDSGQLNNKQSEAIELRGQKMNRVILNAAETIIIGAVVARYTPSAQDVDLNYLEIQYGQDTIRLTGKSAILTAIQKVKKFDWRLIIK